MAVVLGQRSQILAAALLLFGCSSDASDAQNSAESGRLPRTPRLRMDHAVRLAQSGDVAEALSHYLWCWDNGKGDISFTGVRRTFLLSDIMALDSRGVPAKTALRRRMLALEGQSIVQDLDAVADFAALNQVLGESRRTLEFFDSLSRGGEEQRSLIGALILPYLEDLLLVDKRYADILELSSLDLGAVARAPNNGRRALQSIVRSGELLPVYEACLGLEKRKWADRVAAQILEIEGSNFEIYEKLLRCAQRADSKEVMGEWWRRIQASDSTRQRQRFRR